MKCPKCKSLETKVVDSRMVDNGQTIRRRRECEYCTQRFTTFERKGFTELMVVKRDGSKQLYDREKIKKALMLSFAKRNVGLEVIENILNKLENKRMGEGNEIKSKKIGQDILDLLKKNDEVAYIRFASVYKFFSNIDDFKKFINEQAG